MSDDTPPRYRPPFMSTTGQSQQFTNSIFAAHGWQCPICKRVMAPHVSYCLFCTGENEYTYTLTGTGKPDSIKCEHTDITNKKGDSYEYLYDNY